MNATFSNTSLSFVYIIGLLYTLFLIYTTIRILLDTTKTSKTLAYLLLVLILPVLGIAFYYSFGINTRRGRSNKKIGASYSQVSNEFESHFKNETNRLIADHKEVLAQYSGFALFLKNLGDENLSLNDYQLLLNGEEKFPELLKILKNAEHYIHMEYYAWENDIRGNQIKDILLQKVKEGIKVKAIYDAYASRKIRYNIVAELQAGGVEIHPIIKVKLAGLANRLNHRDHRKIVIVDGKVGFVGGINISDRYDNSIDTGLYWRDTHIKITGPGVMNLQRHFMVSWNACQTKPLFLREVLPQKELTELKENKIGLAQIIAGGPIYNMSNIMLSYARLFTLVKKKLYITNPYFIPNETILDALTLAAKSGVDVRLLLPQKSDSALVGAAAKYYFGELLQAGVKVYLYKKGFVHAKTVVADGIVSIVGTANMDLRSFDLNFEIMSVIYSPDFAKELEDAFIADLKESVEINCSEWMMQPKLNMLVYATARLISSFL
ncbi:cardiolipin synthase [Muriicola jejuensis]|uniref:Cardiolipin synthase n=1 Tax=Muriicola jejuensis TaxID=504488 RepID=A0A6P0U6J9_9FLAO|nr:cardiolipin synthase [Muriicola jejuensis]NER08911.1 cardiolipin synthase [Muriicola jejuensis]